MEVIADVHDMQEFPASYPHPTIDSPMGYIFHFPTDGRCKDGAKVGDDGCTWQLAPLTHSISIKEFLDLGANKTYHYDQATGTLMVPTEVGLHNIPLFGKAFQNLPVEIPTCGSRSEFRGSSVSMF